MVKTSRVEDALHPGLQTTFNVQQVTFNLQRSTFNR